jgi:hypothetical protein
MRTLVAGEACFVLKSLGSRTPRLAAAVAELTEQTPEQWHAPALTPYKL